MRPSDRTNERLAFALLSQDIESTIAEKKNEISLQRVALEKAKVNRNHENVLESIRKTIAALPAASQSSQEIVQLVREQASCTLFFWFGLVWARPKPHQVAMSGIFAGEGDCGFRKRDSGERQSQVSPGKADGSGARLGGGDV